MAKRTELLQVDGREINISNPEKVLFPEDGITKLQVVRYYQMIGPRMLPFLLGRPVTLQRFPDGIESPGFIQKSAGRYFPDWITKVSVKKEGGTLEQVICDNVATLVYLASQACITPHVWLSRIERPDFPDEMIFDLDPSTEDLSAVVEGAFLLKELLDQLEMPAFVRSTGSRGLHVVVPLKSRDNFDTTREMARQIATLVVEREPKRYTLEARKNKREDRVYLDINRNGYAQTAVANYAVRAKAGAAVAVPLEWSDVRKKSFRVDAVNVGNIADYLRRNPQPWKGFREHAASPGKIRRRMEKLRAA